jgi:DNA replication protein DnaC
MRETLREILQQLHLQGMVEALDKALERAEKAASPVAEVLYRLALEEQRVRQEKSLTNRLKQARMPWDWTLESFPFTQQPGVNPAQIKTLAGLDFVRRAENLVFIGPPGTGKSGLACSLLRQARLIELDPRYVDVIIRRWQEYTGNQAVRQADGLVFDELAADELSP